MSQWISLDFNFKKVGGTTLFKEEDFCKCQDNPGVYTVNGEWGYWMHCLKCKRPLEDEFHYYNEPELY